MGTEPTVFALEVDSQGKLRRIKHLRRTVIVCCELKLDRAFRQIPHRTSIEPTVKPAPTDVSRTKCPFFRRPDSTASFSARGIVAAVVLPYLSMLMITLCSGMPIFSAADMMMRLLA